MQAALGLSQLNKLEGFLTRRRELVSRYQRLLADLPLTLPTLQPEAESAWHLYVVRLQTERLTIGHRQVFEGLRAAGIGVNVHYIPVHLQPYYRDLGFVAGDFPEAEAYYAQAISLPLFPAMTDAQQDDVIDQLTRLLEERP
jgi:dTDP-4-amino-4,6-dideoxygalactose transaminase